MFFMSLFTVTEAVAADDAVKVLDKASAAFTKAGNVKIGFTATVNGSAASGNICLSGKKFYLNAGGVITWFDGKTLWNYVVNNEEVNVSYPSAKEVARMNPYSFLSLYKKGYKCTMGKSTASEYEVILSGQKSSEFTRVVVRLSKKSYQPTYIKMESKTSMEIKVSSYQTNQKFAASTFTFDKKKYPNVEVIDLR